MLKKQLNLKSAKAALSLSRAKKEPIRFY